MLTGYRYLCQRQARQMLSGIIWYHGEENTRLITDQDGCQEDGFNNHCSVDIKTQQSVAFVADGSSQTQLRLAPFSLNFNFALLQSMYAPVRLLLRHSPKSTPCHLSIGPGSILSTILICLGSHFSPCTVPHYKNANVSIDPSRPATGRKGPLWHHHNMTWVGMRKCRAGQLLHAVHTD